MSNRHIRVSITELKDSYRQLLRDKDWPAAYAFRKAALARYSAEPGSAATHGFAAFRDGTPVPSILTVRDHISAALTATEMMQGIHGGITPTGPKAT